MSDNLWDSGDTLWEWKERAERAEAERDEAKSRADMLDNMLQNERYATNTLEAERDALRHDVERLERAAQVSLERDETARQALRAERDALRAENERLRLEMQAACTSLCPHGLDIAAQKENAERRLREYEHHVMTGRNEQHDRLVAERDALRRDAERYKYLKANARRIDFAGLSWTQGCELDARIDALAEKP